MTGEPRRPVSLVVVNMPAETVIVVRCPTCGEEGRLHFNGGELDLWSCHGHMFALEHGPIYLAHYPPQSDDGPRLAPRVAARDIPRE